MYPTPAAYQEALQLPEAAFVDDDLKRAVPETNALGLPRAVTGAFAAVFPVETRTQRWAVKCFLAPVKDRQARYAAIARHLRQADLPCTVAFDYRRDGIRVNGEVYPVLKMAWAEGTPLNRFVADHLDDPDALAALADAWRTMLADLEDADVAHGDLQHGNVLVDGHGEGLRLRLIDYDTMYVPALRGRKSAEVGHRNFQHPDRDEHDFGPTLDRFSGLVIYTALQAYRHRPALYAHYDTGENLLFRAADFYDPAASPLFEALAEVEALAPWVEALRTACYLEPEAVPALADVAAGTGGSKAQARWGRARRTPPKTDGERRRRWRTSRAPFERAFLPGVAGGLVVFAALLLAGWTLPGLGGLAAGLVAAALMGAGRYRRLPVVRRRRRLRREVAYFDRILRTLHRQVETLERERTALLANVGQMRVERLREVQEEVMEDHLKYHFTSDASRFEGITHKMVVQLKRAGLRNAYHVTPEALSNITALSDESRSRVLMWRRALAGQYQAAVPNDLSPAEERRFERYVAHRLEGLDAEAARTREKIEVQRTERVQALARVEALPPLSFGRYLRFLLRLDTLPPQTPPARPVAAPPPGGLRPAAPIRNVDPEQEKQWWRQAG